MELSCYYSKFSACKSNTGTGIGLVIGVLKVEKVWQTITRKRRNETGFRENTLFEEPRVAADW
jgi:hypothetical protein